jgi:hypothetical protein
MSIDDESLKKIIGGAYVFVEPSSAGQDMLEMARELLSYRQKVLSFYRNVFGQYGRVDMSDPVPIIEAIGDRYWKDDECIDRLSEENALLKKLENCVRADHALPEDSMARCPECGSVNWGTNTMNALSELSKARMEKDNEKL